MALCPSRRRLQGVLGVVVVLVVIRLVLPIQQVGLYVASTSSWSSSQSGPSFLRGYYSITAFVVVPQDKNKTVETVETANQTVDNGGPETSFFQVATVTSNDTITLQQSTPSTPSSSSSSSSLSLVQQPFITHSKQEGSRIPSIMNHLDKNENDNEERLQLENDNRNKLDSTIQHGSSNKLARNATETIQTRNDDKSYFPSRKEESSSSSSSSSSPLWMATSTTDLSFCNRPVLGDPNNATGHMDIWYQCEGEAYETFAQQLHALATRVHASDNNNNNNNKKTLWGRHTWPLPSNARVLIFGNSHARQIGLALACHYAVKDSLAQVVRYDTAYQDEFMAQRFVFGGNNATLFVVANSYAAYSPHWQRLLEQQIDAKLADMHAIILGQFNPNRGVSNFVVNMQHMMQKVPVDYHVDLAHPTPTVRDVAAVLTPTQGLLATSLLGDFLKQSVRRTQQQVQALQQQQQQQQHLNRTNTKSNIQYLNARRYIPKLGGLEGGSASKLEPGPCHNGRNATKMHRCMGRYGGYADLIAWDVGEFVYQTMAAAVTET